MYVYLFTHKCIYPSTNLSILSSCLPINLLVYLSVYRPIYLSSCLPIHLLIYLSVYRPIYLSSCLPIHLLIYLSIYLPMYLSFIYPPSYLSIYQTIYLSIPHTYATIFYSLTNQPRSHILSFISPSILPNSSIYQPKYSTKKLSQY